MNFITDGIRKENEYSGLLDTIAVQHRAKNPLPMLITGMCDGAKSSLLCAAVRDLKSRYGHSSLIIARDEKECRQILSSMSCLGIPAAIFSERDFTYHNITSSHESEHERLSVLNAILNDSIDAVIATPDAALQYTISSDTLINSTRLLQSGRDYDITELCSFLNLSGYTRVDMVDGCGQYSVRGSIIDIFPPRYTDPLRADFFGDTLDRFCRFDVLTQRNIENIQSAEITPAREVVISDEKRSKLAEAISAQIRACGDERIKEILSSELSAVKNGLELNFADKYISLLYPEKETLLDYFNDSPAVFIIDRSGINERLTAYEWHAKETVTSLLEEKSISSYYADYGKWSADFTAWCEKHVCCYVETFTQSFTGQRLSGIFTFRTRQTVSYADSIDVLRDDLGAYIAGNWNRVILCENEAMAHNLLSLLTEDEIPAAVTAIDDCREGITNIAFGIPFSGYDLTDTKTAVMSMYQSSGSGTVINPVRKKATSKKSSRERVMSYADLEIGDYVVHANHGIGQYLGLEKLTVAGFTKDFVKIKYAGTDMLYLPTDQLDMVSKYIGAHSDDGMLKLSKMGGTDWQKQKTRVKTAAKAMAKELIALYAERLRRDGFAFYPDDNYQREFEEAFEYEETEGQIAAINEIKRDMEKATPMDRLLCGDVGFGKTEVALRAAFKAVSSQKQVAILVPTTILALQHYQTMLSRMRNFPVNVDMISRFRSPKQQAESLRRLRRGETDIIVGTHRLLSKDLEFKDLGLLIIDEEQRFGVAAKEKLKQLTKNVDVLTLTATPIPRTLNMAMSGIRDMSILEEAPGDRFPVQTYVLEYDDIIIGEAIRKELRRGGQVFYLRNEIDKIDSTAAKVLELAGGDARVAVAHGKMDREVISDIWKQLIDGELDILVCTTIIETGVDVPNANTLIIEDADRMGLSQLHQIRGRVGRSSRRAYAYFTYQKGKMLTEIAEKRLMAIRDYTEFGAGFKIALRDLEIRGAGNLLGAEQHGHIDSVGYDMYMKLLNEAVLEEKGIESKKKTECQVEITVDAYIPEKYIGSPSQRIDAYKKIASIETDEDITDIRDELIDRYGDVPRTVENLFMISYIRSQGSCLRFDKIRQAETSVLVYPDKLNAAVWSELAVYYKGRILLNAGEKPYAGIRIRRGDDPLKLIAEILKKYSQVQAQQT